MKVVSWNVNGLRAAARKGFTRWLSRTDADVVVLQEVKARPEQLPPRLRAPKGWQATFHPATSRAGYSGVAVLSRVAADEIGTGLGVERFDVEGRVVTARFGDLAVVGAYVPNGCRDHSRVPFKLEFSDALLRHLDSLRRRGLSVVACGDFNTAHGELDLARPRENKRTSGFLPEERASLDRLTSGGWTDAFRRLNPDERRYSWWSPHRDLRKRNVGWRLDYHFVDESLAQSLKACTIHDDVGGSDHCPVSVEW